MTTGYRTIAKKIPDRIRSVKLMTDDDPIGNAKAVSGDIYLLLLFAIWSEFIEPLADADLTCGLCKARLLKNFRELKPVLIELEKEYQVLLALKKKYQ
jgi:hypothetical protein